MPKKKTSANSSLERQKKSKINLSLLYHVSLCRFEAFLALKFAPTLAL